MARASNCHEPEPNQAVPRGAAPPCSQLNATEAQRLLYAQRWVERRTILPSLAEGISLVDR